MSRPSDWLLAAAAAAACLAQPACHLKSTAAPGIEFNTVPEAAEGGADRLQTIAGRVTGVRRGQRVVLYSRSGVWYVQPLIAEPFTEIQPDDTWHADIHLGAEYAALIVDQGYSPPAVIESLPDVGGGIVAIARVKGSAPSAASVRHTVTFGGYEWEVRATPSERGGKNDYDPRNVWVDTDGRMHLLLAERDGRWTSAEVRLTRSLGYGTYVFVVSDTSHLDPAAVLGLLTWDDLGIEQNHRELDVEISRWGDPGNKNAQFVVQPHYVAANVFRFVAPAATLTHSFRWEPGRASFRTVRTAGSGRGTAAVAERDFASGIPVPGTETVHINLLYFRGSPRPPAQSVEVVIEKFQYLP